MIKALLADSPLCLGRLGVKCRCVFHMKGIALQKWIKDPSRRFRLDVIAIIENIFALSHLIFPLRKYCEVNQQWN